MFELSESKLSELLHLARTTTVPSESSTSSLASALYSCLPSQPLSLSSALSVPSAGLWVGLSDGRYLPEAEVQSLLLPFGPLLHVSDGIAVFARISDAALALDSLHGRHAFSHTLSLSFLPDLPDHSVPHPYQGPQSYDTPHYPEGPSTYGEGAPMGVRKFTCRFDISIPNDSHFAVARRLIGLRGQNMKRIVKLSGSDTKLRLRGRGSGFLEGINKVESEEPLHLCVSCKEFEGYKVAVRLVSELLEEIYGEYKVLMDKGLVPKRDGLKVVCLEQPLMFHSAPQVQHQGPEWKMWRQ